jgi:hypothetical protein
VVARTPGVRAGFFLTLQSLWRSLPHRLTLAVAVATGSAVLIVLMRVVPLHRQPGVASTPVALFGIQVVLLGVLLIGFRHAIRLPINLPASWMFDLAWSGDARAYVVGVQRAALIGLAIPVLTFVFPLYVWVLGVRLAVLHWASGLLLFMLGLELVFLNVRRLPFVSRYVPDEHLKAVASLYVIGFAVTSYGIAWFERAAFGTTATTVLYLALLALLAFAGKALGSWQRRNARSWEIGAPEETVPATLGLSA